MRKGSTPTPFIVEPAGRTAFDGGQRIMDLQPTDMHRGTPLFRSSSTGGRSIDTFAADTQIKQHLANVRVLRG